MANYTGPKVRLSRRVGVPIADIPKHNAKRQLNAPGMHGYRGRRLRDYGLRLVEKQKLRYHYNVLEKQFRRAVGEASRRPGNTGELLLQILETRLDNVIRRLGVVRSIWAARQLVVHGHVLINGKKVDRPSYAMSVGDTISFRSKPKIEKLIRENMESMAGYEVPGWIEFNPGELKGKVLAMPAPAQINFGFDLNPNLVIEFYR